VAAVAGFGAGGDWIEHGKTERSTRGDGQKGGFAKHGTLLCDPRGIVELPIHALVVRTWQKVQRMPGALPARFKSSKAVIN